MDTLDIHYPHPRHVKVDNGQDIEVWPLRTRQFGPFKRAAEPLLGLYNALAARKPGDLDWESFLILLPETELAALLADHMDDLIVAVAVALERKPEWVGALFLDDVLALVRAIIGANLDFFLQNLLPRIGAMMAENPPNPIPGATPSTPSPMPATAISAA